MMFVSLRHVGLIFVIFFYFVLRANVVVCGSGRETGHWKLTEILIAWQTWGMLWMTQPMQHPFPPLPFPE